MMMFLPFLVLPLIEIALFIVIGGAIGLWPTLLGVLVTALIGAVVLRLEGAAVLRQLQATLQRGQLPARAIADAMLIGLAGLLLLLPGYFSDLVGILLLIPPVRTLLYRLLSARMVVVTTPPGGFGGTGGRGRIDTNTIDLDDDQYRPR